VQKQRFETIRKLKAN